ncbi:MAG: amylo-alpha-1,6-glucosidase, partial [Prevotella sp.]|nr:amylo-alpha-1,6-glucosidase [Prevotella sp.]
SNEDLYVPGYFEVEMKRGDSFVFAAGTKEVGVRTLQKLFEEEISYRTPRNSFWNMLVTAAHQFHNRVKGTGKTPDEDDRYLLAGYPWFKCRARDTFISLPGLTLSIGEQDYFELVMKTSERALREFMDGLPSTTKMAEVELPDVMLWAIWAIQQYSHYTDAKTCYARYGQLVHDIVTFIEQGKHPNLRLDDNGLLWSNGLDRAVTWMNSTANGHPVVPRTGYIVEFNALWYNALKFSAQMAADTGNAESALRLERQAALTQQSFVATFLNEYGYLFDYVDPNIGQDWSVRPNMIFAVALDYSPLTPQQMKGVVDICTRELLTPKGLRSLSPKSGGYNPMYVGPQTQRDYAYHQGTAWPWLGGFYMEAMLKLYKRSRLSFIERQMVGYEDEMDYHAIGTISELFDGNPPFHGRGAMAFAMNVAEILRTQELPDKYNS